MITLFCLAFAYLASMVNADTPACTVINPSESNSTSTVCVASTTTTNGTSWIFNRCPPNQYCSVPDLSNLVNTNCVNLPVNKILKYSKMACSTPDDCHSKNCVNGTCAAVAQGSPCSSSAQCDFGFACISVNGTSTCAPQKKVGDNCSVEFECVNYAGCMNGKCTEYFSVDAGVNTGADDRKDTGLSFCKSGISINQVCTNLTLTNGNDTWCGSGNTTCNYTDSTGKSIVLPSSCECTFTNDTDRQCKFGTDEIETFDFINVTRTALKTLTKCNTEERTVKCLSYFYNLTKSEFKLIDDYKFTFWMRNNRHKILGLSASAVVTAYNATVFNDIVQFATPSDDPNPPAPIPTVVDANATAIHQCPRFACPAKTNTTPADACAIVKAATNGTVFNNVSLYKNCDNTKQYCDWGRNAYAFITLNGDKTFSCKNITQTGSRYGGEDCKEDGDCVAPLKCSSGKCAGNSTGVACTTDVTCNVGLFCLNGNCTALKKSGEACNRTFDCQNKLVCNNGTCINMFSVKSGSPVNATGTDNQYKSYYCETGRINGDNYCISRKYNNMTAASGFVQCNVGAPCNYTDSAGNTTSNISIPCQCGYNADGKAYCPIDDNSKTSEFSSYKNNYIATVDNECHTLSRFSCYKNSAKVRGAYETSRQNYLDAHLFNGAVDCASEVLSSVFANISLGLLAILAALLF